MLERAGRLLGGEGVELVLGDARDLSGVNGTLRLRPLQLQRDRRRRARGPAEDPLRGAARAAARRPLPLFVPLDRRTAAGPETREVAAVRRDPASMRSTFARGRFRHGWRIRKINRELDLDSRPSAAGSSSPAGVTNFQVDDYYVDPEFQVEQLREAGFEVSAIFDISRAARSRCPMAAATHGSTTSAACRDRALQSSLSAGVQLLRQRSVE